MKHWGLAAAAVLLRRAGYATCLERVSYVGALMSAVLMSRVRLCRLE